MRTLLGGFLLLTLLAPKPKPAGNVRITRSLCPATGSCRVILSWTRPGNYAAATDTAHTLWLAAPDTLRKGTPLGAADTLLAPRPADGQTASGTVRLCYTRKGWSGQACNAPVAWSVTAPVSPVDTATAVKVSGYIVKPDSVTVVAMKQQQFCAFVRFASGHVGFRRATEGGIPACDSTYRALPLVQRSVTPAEQAVADSACVRWSATGGSITTEPCSGVPS